MEPIMDGSSQVAADRPVMIAARGLSKTVPNGTGTLTIVHDLDLTVSAGETLGIVGASGSGKSTLLALLAGLDTASTGTVLLDGVDLGALDEDGRAAVRARAVGFVFQSFQLLPSLTALENVMLPLELAGALPLAQVRRAARQMLEQVGLGERLGHWPRQLSGGEQQRVALARAFVVRPRVLFADEPTGNLDAETGAAVIEQLFALNREQAATLVIVTHDAGVAARCSRIVRLARGRIVSG
jgi:putative ABC transport system ATP-binding protein